MQMCGLRRSGSVGGRRFTASCTREENNAKFDMTVDEGKECLNPSWEKNESTHRRKKAYQKSCVTFLLCDSCVTPGRTSNEVDVQNEWEEKTNTHTAAVQQYIQYTI